MQQTMDEIIDYLATIDEKLDDVLRAQEDAVWADMIGVGLDIDEAMTIREHAGRVSEVTWSKVQATSATIARTQAYALRQLDALAEKMERKAKIGDLAKMAKEAESKVQGWLVVLARCFQLQDAIAVLELDRVLDAAPDDLDGHRLGLKASRQKRLDTISRSTERLMARMDAAAGTANTKVLLHPTTSPAVVQSREHVASAVADFHGRLGIESGRQSLEAKRWGTRPRRSGTRCSRQEQSASMFPGVSVTRPLTGPDRCRAGSPAGSPSEHSADAAGRTRNATSKAE